MWWELIKPLRRMVRRLRTGSRGRPIATTVPTLSRRISDLVFCWLPSQSTHSTFTSPQNSVTRRTISGSVSRNMRFLEDACCGSRRAKTNAGKKQQRLQRLFDGNMDKMHLLGCFGIFCDRWATFWHFSKTARMQTVRRLLFVALCYVVLQFSRAELHFLFFLWNWGKGANAAR